MRKNVYECDRCGREESVPDTEVPAGWHTLKLGVIASLSTLGAALVDAIGGEKQVCAKCVESYRLWFTDLGVPAERTTTERG